MQSPSSGSWRYSQIPKKTIITDGLKGLFISIGVGLTTATFLFATTLALTLIAGAANAEELNDLQKRSSGSLLVKNAQTGEYTPTPTLATEVEIDVSGMLSRTKVSQKFRNNSKDWVEGIYVFPLPDNAAVDRLRMRIGSRIIEGQIKEKKVAKKMFHEAKKSGKKATLVEQERSNIFTTSLTNIAPGESITVEIEYQNTLDYREGIVRLRFPLVVAPRYISGREHDALNAPYNVRNAGQDANRISPPVIDESEPKRNFVNLSINLDAGFSIANIQSTNHDIRKKKITDRKYTIQLASDSVPADRDFEVTWRSAPNAMPSSAVYTEIKGDKHFSLITLFPPTVPTEPDVRLPRDVIFVVDTSGSMHGSSLDQAKSALTMAVRRLTKNDRFNIIQFDDQTKTLFDRERPASNKNLKVACQYIDALTADGGTEFAPALRAALTDEVKTGRIRQIVFITDGSIGNEDQIFSMIKSRLGANRLFPIGIGSAPNSHLMTKIAEYGRGSFTYIGNISEVAMKMGELFNRLENPIVTDITTTWPKHFNVDITPEIVPDLYQGEPLVIIAETDNFATGSLQISGMLAGKEWSRNIDLDTQTNQQGIGQVWARRKISEHMGSLRGGAPEDKVRKAIVNLALEHSLITKYTSLVAVDITPSRTTEFMYRQRIPVNLPSRWSQAKIFGTLPQTATLSSMHLMLSALFSILALACFVRQKTYSKARAK